ncbi:MAG: ABC transporter ATP-binding protein, partial [Gammaproteobacteria bacterium]|nr:ABC transporter ATP-binding protein [Gammaproteobacteria bacterium]
VFPYTVRDMGLMGRTVHRGLFSSPREHDALRAQQALDQLGIGDLASREFTRISGGQRQLALIARALAQDTPIVVMDEPTASLDFGNQVRVLQQVRKLSEAGLGIVLSTHNPDHALACASRVLVLADGTLQASGSPDTVLTGELLSSVYQVEVRLERLSHGQHVCVPHLDGNTGKRFRPGD